MSAKKKQEEKHLKSLKALQQLECNKRCFECDQRGPAYINVTIGSFVCTSCGGILRGLNPPHRVKSVSMATFTPNEITFIESRGNEYCKNIYLGKFDSKSKPRPDSKDHAKLRYFMEQKYEHKRWYIPPEQAQKPTETVKQAAAPTAVKTDAVKPLSSLLGNTAPQLQINKPSHETAQGGNIFADFSTPVTNPASTASQPSSNTVDGFADFGNAFAGSNFDGFGDFTSGTPSNASTISGNVPAATTSSGFANFSSLMTPMTSDQNQKAQPAPAKAVDKYADLGDLFSIPTPASTDAVGWSGSSPSNNSIAGSSVFGAMSSSQPQKSVFGSNQNSVFGSSQAQQSSVFGTQQNSVFVGVSQNNVMASQNQAPSTFGMQQSSNAFGNSTQLSSSPFSYTQQANTSQGGTATFNTAQGASAFPAAQGGASGFGFMQQPNAIQVGTSAFGFSQQSTAGTAAFGLASNFGGASQAAGFNAKTQQQGFMTGNSPAAVPNPFMQSAQSSAPVPQSQNPFMMQQSSQQPFASQSNPTTNPFMSSANTAQPNTANPFF